MPEIKLEHITKRWGKFYAVEDLNLTIADNSFVTLLGPSGCGKTTTLRMIAGLETPTSGRITIGDQVVFDSAMGINVPANKRRVGFLFQNYALWPNMTVYENISFGLTNVKEDLPKIDFDTRVNARLAEILSAPGEVTKVLAECRDKKGKLDDKKALLKLIDTLPSASLLPKSYWATTWKMAKMSVPKPPPCEKRRKPPVKHWRPPAAATMPIMPSIRTASLLPRCASSPKRKLT